MQELEYEFVRLLTKAGIVDRIDFVKPHVEAKRATNRYKDPALDWPNH